MTIRSVLYPLAHKAYRYGSRMCEQLANCVLTSYRQGGLCVKPAASSSARFAYMAIDADTWESIRILLVALVFTGTRTRGRARTCGSYHQTRTTSLLNGSFYSIPLHIYTYTTSCKPVRHRHWSRKGERETFSIIC